MATQTFVSVIYRRRQITCGIGLGAGQNGPKVSVLEVSVNYSIDLTYSQCIDICICRPPYVLSQFFLLTIYMSVITKIRTFCVLFV